MISTQDLEAIAAGRVIDSTQAPQIARELIAARVLVNAARSVGSLSVPIYSPVGRDLYSALLSLTYSLGAYDDAAREAE